MSSKNIKGALLNFGLSYGSELGVSSLYIKVELVKPDGTVLATPYSNTYSTSYNYDRGTWGLFSFNSWWDNNVCYVNKMGHQINTEQFYLYDSFADYDTNWDNYITTTSYQLLDNDVRLRIYFYADTRDDNYSDVYIHAYLSSVSFG